MKLHIEREGERLERGNRGLPFPSLKSRDRRAGELESTRCDLVGLGRFVQPIALEVWVKGYVAGVPVPVLGKADVIEHGQVIDTKTGKNLFHKPQPSHMIQGAIYIFCTGLPIRWHSVSQKPAATTNDELTMYPTPKVLAAAERYVRDAYEGIRDNLRARGPRDIWPVHGPATGTCRYCALRGTCPGYPDY